MILRTIIPFKVRNSILGASNTMGLTKDQKLHSHLMPSQFGPKCGLSPNYPTFFFLFFYIFLSPNTPGRENRRPIHLY